MMYIFMHSLLPSSAWPTSRWSPWWACSPGLSAPGTMSIKYLSSFCINACCIPPWQRRQPQMVWPGSPWPPSPGQGQSQCQLLRPPRQGEIYSEVYIIQSLNDDSYVMRSQFHSYLKSNVTSATLFKISNRSDWRTGTLIWILLCACMGWPET